MAEISASMVKELRDRTGVGMMDAKKALVAADGDADQAIKNLREAGVIKAGKKADRDTTEGRIEVARHGDKTVLIAIACETDFVARNDEFKAFCAKIATSVANAGTIEGIDNLAFVDGGTIGEAISAAVLKLGENMKVADARMLGAPGFCGSYVHHDGKSGAIVRFSGEPSEAAIKVANQVSIHVVASKPIALNAAAVDPKVVAEEREVYAKLVEQEGKPENIREKIVDGKIKAFFKDRVLVEQTYCMDNKKIIKDMAKEAGGHEITAFEAIFI